MRVTRAIGVIGCFCVLGLGCAVSGHPDGDSGDYGRDDDRRVGHAPQTYVVRPHDTLYSIAWHHRLDYRELARWNHLGPDYRIAVGQTLRLSPAMRSPAPAGPPAASSQSSARASSSPHVATPPLVAQSPAGSEIARSWVWPTAHTEAPRPVPGGGILLLGQLGQPVRAACSGRVVYVGNGIRGYGNLIIIKHGETLLSAYAHTRSLDVREGQDVAGGQVIAQMGTGPHQIAALYFEIRRNGKPVDPLPYLTAGTK